MPQAVNQPFIDFVDRTDDLRVTMYTYNRVKKYSQVRAITLSLFSISAACFISSLLPNENDRDIKDVPLEFLETSLGAFGLGLLSLKAQERQKRKIETSLKDEFAYTPLEQIIFFRNLAENKFIIDQLQLRR